MSIPRLAQRRLYPSRDPEYPYNPAHEARVLRDAQAVSAYTVEYWESKDDDFDPDVNERLHSVPEDERPFNDGDGAIYSLEYLARRRGC